MKLTEQLIKKIIAEEKIRAIVEFHVPWSKKDFFNLLSEAKWYDKLDPNSTAYKIAMAAGRQYDQALEKQLASRNPKGLSMTRDDFMKSAVYQNAGAEHKFARFQDFEFPGSLPRDDMPADEVEEIIKKGYPEEGLPSRKISTSGEVEKFVTGDPEASGDIEELETYVSPYGYIHSKIKMTKFKSDGYDVPGATRYVYVGDYAIEPSTGVPGINKPKRRRAHPSSWYAVTKKTLESEKKNPSPDRDKLWSKSGSVDVQDPTMEESMIKKIAEQVYNVLREE